MNESKYVRKINKILKKHLHCKITYSLDFYYDKEKDEIGWGLLETPSQSEHFTDFFENVLKCPKCNEFIYAIFHEYGHKMTLKYFDDEELDNYESFIEYARENKTEKTDYQYYAQPIELAASLYAVEYIKSHYKEITKWYHKALIPAINDLINNDENTKELIKIVKGR